MIQNTKVTKNRMNKPIFKRQKVTDEKSKQLNVSKTVTGGRGS